MISLGMLPEISLAALGQMADCFDREISLLTCRIFLFLFSDVCLSVVLLGGFVETAKRGSKCCPVCVRLGILLSDRVMLRDIGK